MGSEQWIKYRLLISMRRTLVMLLDRNIESYQLDSATRAYRICAPGSYDVYSGSHFDQDIVWRFYFQKTLLTKSLLIKTLAQQKSHYLGHQKQIRASNTSLSSGVKSQIKSRL